MMLDKKYIPVYCPDFGEEERAAIASTAWTQEFLTANKICDKFEREFARHVGRKHAVMTNSGSSAVLIAVAAQHWKRGDKIITPAVTFGTTISPLLIYGLVPVFVDVIPGTYNVDPHQCLDAMSKVPGIAGAVIPHTLGNPVDPNVWGLFYKSVEDACDALGSKVDGNNCGTFGTVSTFSFFPAHHITAIEGGMALANHDDVARDLFRFANWGRDCWCRAGQNSVCGKRFEVNLEGIEYDHKYEFRYAGFNLRGDELRAAVARVQMKKLHLYEAARKRNYEIIDRVLRPLDDLIIPPISLTNAEPVWFSYPITLKKGSRKEITMRLEEKGVATRLIFAGNITKHGCMKGVEYCNPFGLQYSDQVMKDSFSIGLNQTISEEEAHYIADTLKGVLTS